MSTVKDRLRRRHEQFSKNGFNLYRTRSQRSEGVRSSPLDMFYSKVYTFDFFRDFFFRFFFTDFFCRKKISDFFCWKFFVADFFWMKNLIFVQHFFENFWIFFQYFLKIIRRISEKKTEKKFPFSTFFNIYSKNFRRKKKRNFFPVFVTPTQPTFKAVSERFRQF